MSGFLGLALRYRGLHEERKLGRRGARWFSWPGRSNQISNDVWTGKVFSMKGSIQCSVDFGYLVVCALGL